MKTCITCGSAKAAFMSDECNPCMDLRVQRNIAPAQPKSIPKNSVATSRAKDFVSPLRESSNYKGFRSAVSLLTGAGYIGIAVYIFFSLMAGPEESIFAFVYGAILAVGIYVTCQAFQILADISDKLVSKE